MPAPVIVPRDKSLDQARTGQVRMLIIGSSPRANELAAEAGRISGRESSGCTNPRCAVQVTTDDAIGLALRQEVGETPTRPSSPSSATAPSSAPSSTTATSSRSISRICSWRPERVLCFDLVSTNGHFHSLVGCGARPPARPNSLSRTQPCDEA